MARHEYLNVTTLTVGAPGINGTLTVGNSGTNTITLGGTGTNTVNIGTTGTLTTVQVGGAAKPATFTIGVFASTAAGSGIKLSSTRTSAFRVYADDGGTALTSATRAGVARMLVDTAISTGDVSTFGFQAQLKVNANVAPDSGNMAGLWAYLEITAGSTVSDMAAICAMVDCPATGVIANGKYLSALRIYSNDINCTHTGKATLLHVLNPAAGTWDYFAVFDSATGVIADTGAGGGTSKYLKCLIGGTAYSILIKSDA